MANNTDLTFIVDTTQLTKAFKESTKVETQIRKLAKAEASGSLTAKQYSDQVGLLATQLQKQSGGSIQARNSVNAYSRATLKSARETSASTKEMVKQAKALETLKSKYNPVYRSANQFKNTLRELNEAHQKGAISNSRHAETVENLKMEYRQFLNGTAGWSNQFVEGGKRAGKSLNKFGAYTQQFGYQMSDFVVQVQGGTSAFVAFGQQGAQLFGLISGPWGATLSIGAALVGAFGAAWMKSKDQMAQAETGAKSLEERITSINEAVEEYFRNQKALGLGVSKEQLTLAEAQAKTEEARLDRLQKHKQMLATGIDPVLEPRASGFEDYQVALKAEREATRELNRLRLQEYLEVLETQTKWEIEASIEAFQSKEEASQKYWQSEIKRMNAAIAEEEAEYKNLLDGVAKHQSKDSVDPLGTEEYVENMAKMFLATQDLVDELSEGAKEVLRLADVDISKGISEAAKEAAILAANLGVSLAEALSLVNLTKTYSGRGSGGMPGGTQVLTGFDIQGAIDKFKNKTKRGGSGGSKETASDFLAGLQRELDFKEELLGLSEREREVTSEVYKLREQVLSKGYDISDERLESYVREKIALEEKLQLEQDIQSSISNGLMDIITQTESVEDAFKQMMFNIIESIYQQEIVTPLAQAGSDLLSGLLMANGGAFSGGVQMFANGGVVNSPTAFGHSGGLGVMGEAGPEAIMPLKRGSDGKLGVASSGGGGTSVVQVQLSPELIGQILTQAEQQSVQVVNKAAGPIVEQSVSAVMTQRRRGGPMKSTFG